MRRADGFTLIEVMIACAIIALLASIALPAYTQYVIRGRLAEAHSALLSKRVDLEQFFQDNRTFVGFDCTADATANFTFSCTTQTATNYVLQADGVGGTSVDDFVFTLDAANARSTAAVPVNWQAAAGCWIIRKNGSCG